MSEGSGKHYNDYFNALEKQLNKPARQRQPETPPRPSYNRKSKHSKKGVFWVFRLRKSVLLSIVAIIVAAAVIICVAVGNGDKVGSNMPPVTDNDAPATAHKNNEQAEQKRKISYEFTPDTASLPETNDVKNAIIINKTDNTIVAARDAEQRAYPASTTKIMTLLVAVENITDFNDTFTMTLDITDPLFVEGASVAGFLNGEQITITDLLYGTILPSGADAAMGLAIKIAGSEKAFVNLMNEKVKELGLKNTNFTNVTGLHNEKNYSTAYDMAVILDAAMQNEMCRKILSTYQHTTESTPQHPQGIPLSSTLFSYMYGTEPETATILGGKTGFVNQSGYCIASYGENNQNKNEYIVVALGNSSRHNAIFGLIDLYKQFAK